MLVGAPFAQTSQRRLQNTGAVYGCEVDTNLCVEIFFDQKGDFKLNLNDIKIFKFYGNNIFKIGNYCFIWHFGMICH